MADGNIALWAQATAIQSVKALIPITLDLKASNYSKWRNMVNIAVHTYALADHLTTAVAPADEEWLRLDSTVLRWLYGSIAPDILDMVMMATTSAYSVWTRIEALFRDNQQARAGYLGQKFRNLEQEGKSITAYCLEQKAVADALADVGAPVTDDALVWNVLKGLDEAYDNVAALVPLLTPFPSFLQLRNMLLLQELKPHHGGRGGPSNATALYSNTGGGAAPGPRGPTPPRPPPPSFGAPPAGGYGAPAPYNTVKNKGKKKKGPGGYGGGGYGTAPPCPTPYNPWTGAIYMYPMGSNAGILGPRPAAPPPRPVAHGFTATPQPQLPYHPQQLHYYGAPAPAYQYAPAPTAPHATPSWDTAALINQLNTMTLQPPMEWHMDTGASAHMSSDAGPSYQGRDPSV
nr:uncharacterized protein LOC127303864 [Lolium perenne]